MKTFFGDLYIEDPNFGKKMLCVLVGEDIIYGGTIIELHDAKPPNSLHTLVGRYGSYWSLKKLKWRLFVTEYELTLLQENPPTKVRCLTGHKFGKMLEAAIETLKT